jgi:hypothetical protein
MEKKKSDWYFISTNNGTTVLRKSVIDSIVVKPDGTVKILIGTICHEITCVTQEEANSIIDKITDGTLSIENCMWLKEESE